MLGSGFLTAAIGEPLVTLGCPARPAGLGDAEAVRPGDSWNIKQVSSPIQKRKTTKIPPVKDLRHLLLLLLLALLAALLTKTAEWKKVFMVNPSLHF